MQVQTVIMYELDATNVGLKVALQFRRYHGDAPTRLMCKPSSIIERRPLKVQLRITPDLPIADMHRFEGQDVFLIQALPFVPALNNGE